MRFNTQLYNHKKMYLSDKKVRHHVIDICSHNALYKNDVFQVRVHLIDVIVILAVPDFQ